MNASDAQGDPTHYLETVTHTSNANEKFTYTSNGYFEHKLLSNCTLPVVVSTMNPRIDDRIAPIGGASQTLSTPATKEVSVHAVCGGEWVNRTLRQVSRTGVDRSTPCDTGLDVWSKPDPSPVMIGIPTISPACGLSIRFQFGEKLQSSSPDEVRNAKKI